MKKNYLLSIVLAGFILLSACGPAAVPDPTYDVSPSPTSVATPDTGNVDANKVTPTPLTTKEPLRMLPEQYDDVGFIKVDVKEHLRKYLVKDEKTELDIPVYYYEELIHEFRSDRYQPLIYGRDIGYSTVNFPNSSSHALDYILTTMPTEAIRTVDGGKFIYLMYDTDQGQRLYLFFEDINDSLVNSDISGFVVLMQERLSYSDFQGLKVGDEMSELAEIDPVMKIYSDYLYGSFTEEDLKLWEEKGVNPSTISILTDGALKITYKNVDGKLLVEKFDFSEDFRLDGYMGKTNYRIAEIDYVD